MTAYVGRYAPTPSGPLHLGSLLAATASYVDARAHGGAWLLRIDDLDAARTVAGASEDIIATLRRFGFEWDGDILYQSQRHGAHAKAIASLLATGRAFRCACTRREQSGGPEGHEGPIYPGTCRRGMPAGRRARSTRLCVADVSVACPDAIQGRYTQRLARDVGDFVLGRVEGHAAYQLATVVDDAWQGVTHVVRGADLLSSAPRQMYLAEMLDLAAPVYAHIPVLVDDQGRKLSKSTGALGLADDALGPQLVRCLSLLGQRPPATLACRTPAAILRWAIDHWSREAVPRLDALIVPQG